MSIAQRATDLDAIYLLNMEFWQALVLGVVQGVTEFLPVSSSGHLELARAVMGIEMSGGLAFDAFLHLGTLLAVVVYFWRDLLNLAQTLFRKLGRLPVNERDFVMLQALVVATIPAAFAGFFLQSYIETNIASPLTVAAGMCIAAFLFMYAEWKQFNAPWRTPLTLRTGFMIGLFQMCALIPGLSRSGATTAGGMLLGLTRYEASRFAFLLAVPITAGAGLKNALDFIAAPDVVAWGALVAGTVVAFVCALLVIHYFLLFIRKYTLWPFVWYSLVIAALVLYAEFFAWG